MKKLALLILVAVPLFAAAQVPSYVPANGLVGWWPFSGNANDESGNGSNGVVTGAILTNDRFGSVNSAYQFDGTSSYIQTTASGFLGQHARTFSFWVNTTSAAHQAPIDFYGGSGGAFSIVMNNPCPGIGVDCATGVAMKGDQVLLNGNWHHCVLVYDSTLVNTISDVIIYVDGQIQSQVTCSALNSNCTINNTNSTDIVFGKTVSDVRYVDGKLDDIGIWDRALTPCEIEALYSSGNSGLTLSTSATTLCVSDGSANLVALPSGGTWSGTGVTGYAFNPAVSGAGTFYPVYTATNASGCVVSDSLPITVDVCTGITANAPSTFSVYPNPANNSITVSWSAAVVKTLTLRDAAGRALRTYNVTGTQAQLSLEGLASGVYLLSADGEETAVQKIIKQ